MHTRYARFATGHPRVHGHDLGMPGRRQFLEFIAGAAVASAVRPARGAPPATPAHSKIRAIAFDLFTIFDPRSVTAVAESIVPGRARELCESWRVRLFEYSWLHAAA